MDGLDGSTDADREKAAVPCLCQLGWERGAAVSPGER